MTQNMRFKKTHSGLRLEYNDLVTQTVPEKLKYKFHSI